MMPLKLQKIYVFLYTYEQNYIDEQEKSPKGDRTQKYSHSSFILFFISLYLKRVFRYKKMARLAKKDYAHYGFVRAPSRKTIRMRFKKLPSVIVYLMPQITQYCYTKPCHRTFSLKCLFSDKSIFRAKGGLWYQKFIQKNIISHSSIDTEASWAYSPCHKWRFSYALLLMVNQNHFPVAAIADTASLKEPHSIEQMIQTCYQHIGIIVRDAVYKVYEVIRKLLLTTKYSYKSERK